MDDEKRKKPFWSAVKQIFKNSGRLWKIVWKEKKITIIVMLFLYLLVSALPFLTSGTQGILINHLVEITGKGAVDWYLAIILFAFIFFAMSRSLVTSVLQYLDLIFYFYLEEKFEFLSLKKKGEIDISVHEDPKMNDLFNRVNENGTWRIRAFTDRQFFIVQNIIEVVIASAILIVFKWWVFLIIVVGTLPEFFVEAAYGRQIWSIHASAAEIRRKFWVFRTHFQRVPHIVELKLFQNTHYFIKHIKKLFRIFLNKEKKVEKRKFWFNFGSLVLSESTIGFAIIYFVVHVVKGSLLIGTLTFVIASIGGLRRAFSGLFMNLGRQYQDSLFVSDFFEFLNIKPVVKKIKNPFRLDNKKTPEIYFDNISFAYPGAEKNVLKNLSLKIRPGEKLALVGVNGAGKTTLVKLLCRFYDPTKGKILINQHDLKKIKLEDWYKQLGAIFQDYSHYHFLVKEAIAIGRTGQKNTLQKVKDAARASEADIFIEGWEHGYQQMLGKQFRKGIEPSIGQWQKLALARVFYRDPRILVLDEPTSSIDAEAEEKIFEKIESLPKDRSVILISHRFSTVRHADKIAVIENSTIKECGTHKELITMDKTYARLFKLQAKSYE